MKLMFRFFRGELNGFFLNALCTFLNGYMAVTGMFDELVYQARFQWLLEEDSTAIRLGMRESDIYGLGKIGGLFQPRTAGRTSLNSIWFTNSRMPDSVRNGRMRTERGLLDMDLESFRFFRTANDNYATDINTLANEKLKTTYREYGATAVGYVKEGSDIFDAAGNLIMDNIWPSPPVGAAYVVWYGPKYLHYEEFFDTELPITIDIYKLLFEVMQRVRRHGASLQALLEITEILGGGYIQNLGGKFGEGPIEQVGYQYYCYYDLDPRVIIFNRERRYAAWLNVLSMKFKMFNFIDRAQLV